MPVYRHPSRGLGLSFPPRLILALALIFPLVAQTPVSLSASYQMGYRFSAQELSSGTAAVFSTALECDISQLNLTLTGGGSVTIDIQTGAMGGAAPASSNSVLVAPLPVISTPSRIITLTSIIPANSVVSIVPSKVTGTPTSASVIIKCGK